VLVAIGLAVTISSLWPRDVAADDALPPQTDGGPLPADVHLHVGDTVTLDGGALQVSLEQVAEDSRCPMDVMCVWQGRALVELHVTVDGVDRGLVSATLVPGPQRLPDLDAIVERYAFSLTDLQPYPQASQPQPLDQRVATLHVSPWTP
jgi:hypothetical protein